MDDLRISENLVIPERELKWRFDPSGGPGGQHSNKSSTRAELTFDVGASTVLTGGLRAGVLERLGSDARNGQIVVQINQSRSQWRNRQIARRRLADLLREATSPRPPRRKRTRPTRAAHERRLAAKKARGETKRLRRRPFHPE